MTPTERVPFLRGATPRVIAHRGLDPAGPGNTLGAFRRALAAGADILETDARASLDGVAVLVHDAEVIDSAGRRHVVADERWEELASLELPGGESLLALADALRLLPDALITIDVKANAAILPVAAAVNDAGAQDRVLLTSFSERRRTATLRRVPGAATSASAARFVVALLAAHAGLPLIVRAALRGIDALQVPERALGLSTTEPRPLLLLRAGGREVHIWTVNEPERMALLLRRGVDGIVTDRSDLARTEIDAFRNEHSRARPNTPPT
ncbi:MULTISPECIES: glycerophosphodiester phosphodiesterase family protein [unclassified Rathayibacter]|uniref:glycerophosphodiester phosphodiesterase family protein n=1 Tax=unclassified Rathayibacter TaxID=2609250 RepID=UPI00188BB25E|nr:MULTISPECIES: glycerophosphodiester phosphodiesterase family protein [unclassified Rathayibacter]MBF4462327.1 glycerophosphodiester phosphodiesterase [Rathayibacter sp. VKM Ac-2879]MBF4503630.1 glycerophosphodiester phosphodiesterase [Rathayibacter sp. VKM Ac-2878]